MTTDVTLWFLAAYITVFLVQAFRAHQFQWLWGSIILWLGLGIIGSRLLPGIWGITRLTPLYMPQLYIFLASIFFFIHEWQRLPEKHWYETRNGGVFLSLFAVSSALMHIVYLVLLCLIWVKFPGGLTPYVLPALLELYLFNPVYWIMSQFTIMTLFYLHRHIVLKQKANRFSSLQLQGGVLLATCFQVAFIAFSLIRFGI